MSLFYTTLEEAQSVAESEPDVNTSGDVCGGDKGWNSFLKSMSEMSMGQEDGRKDGQCFGGHPHL